MISLLYQARNSNVQHVFSCKDDADLMGQLLESEGNGQLLSWDKELIHQYLAEGVRHVIVNHVLHFEVIELDEENTDPEAVIVG